MGKLINEIGKKYNYLTVIEKIKNDSDTKAYYKCKCDCGNEHVVSGYSLRSGKTKSCGCLKHTLKEHIPKEDLTGKKYNKLTVLKLDGYRNNKYKWLCKCDCGKEIVVAQTNLIHNKSTQCTECGIKSRGAKKTKHLQPGEKYTKLTIIEQVHKENKRKNDTLAYYKCKCDCGNERVVSGYSLRSGKTKSCGCLRSELFTDVSVIGKKFGMLTIIEIVKKPDTCAKWVKCKCDCGKEIVMRYANLTDPRADKRCKSCGCLKESFGERTINAYLSNNNITYKRQQTFKDLYVVKESSLLKYDFAVKSRNGKKIYFLIEFDGEQHFKENNFYKTSLEKVQYYDNLKNEYAKKNEIPLLRISYKDTDRIETILNNYITENFNFLIKKDA